MVKRKRVPSPPRIQLREEGERTVETSSLPTNMLPTSDEWQFRLKVLASPADLSQDVLEDAVQGLVKICFPHNILEELGVNIVETHMLQLGAHPERIDRMRDLFHEAMIHRAAHMLAMYLDSPERLHLGKEAVVHSAKRLFRYQGNRDKGNDGVYHSHREEQSTFPVEVHLARSTHNVGDETISGEGGFHSAVRSGSKGQIHAIRQTVDISADHVEHDKKVSTSWRWNLDSDAIGSAGVSKHFKRPSDLFAYHALPSIRQELRSITQKKPIRAKIQSTLDELSDVEYGQWVAAFERLRSGDLTMLERVLPVQGRAADGRQTTCMTPAPPS